MAKKRIVSDLLYGELYAHYEDGKKKWFGVPLRPTGRLSGEYQFWTRDGYRTGESCYCTRIWEKNLLNEYKDLRNEAQGK